MKLSLWLLYYCLGLTRSVLATRVSFYSLCWMYSTMEYIPHLRYLEMNFCKQAPIVDRHIWKLIYSNVVLKVEVVYSQISVLETLHNGPKYTVYSQSYRLLIVDTQVAFVQSHGIQDLWERRCIFACIASPDRHADLMNSDSKMAVEIFRAQERLKNHCLMRGT